MPGKSHDGPTIGEAITEYLRQTKRQARVTAADYGQKEMHARWFEKAFGSDTLITSITRRDAGRWFQAVRALPSRFGENKALKGLPFFEMAEKAKRLSLEPMHNRTVNSYVVDVRGLFADALLTGLIERNPFEGMNMPEAGYVENKDKPWKAHQLEGFFRSPLFLGCRASNAVFEAGTLLLADWRFWVPLIALTSGARVGEIAQLRPGDVREEDGIWFYDISDEGGRRIKNTASRRKTPVHPELVRIGLLKLAKDRQAAGAESLLPSVPKPMGGSASHGLTKWMTEKAAPALVPDRAKGQGWHSFRHCLQDLSRAAGNPDSVTDRLAGRTPEGTGGRYGAFGLPMLRDALEKLTFPDWLAAIPARSSALP